MKFSIRDLMWFTVVIAILVGAWLERRHLASENALLRKETEGIVENAQRAIAEQIQLERREAKRLRTSIETLPNSTAPAPKPPKP